MSTARPVALIIEDDPNAAEALGLILRDWGAEVVHGADGDAAIAAVGPRLADIQWIVTDFNLGPGPDGVAIAKRLAPAAPQARILVLSGSFHGRATVEAGRAGFKMLPKPARAEAIIAWLEGR